MMRRLRALFSARSEQRQANIVEAALRGEEWCDLGEHWVRQEMEMRRDRDGSMCYECWSGGLK